MSIDEIVLRFDGLPPSMASGGNEGTTDEDAVWIRAQALKAARTLRARFEGPVGLEFTFFAPQPPPPRTAALITSMAAEALHGGAGTDLATSDDLPLTGPWQVREARWRHTRDPRLATTLRVYAVRETLDQEPVVFAWHDGTSQSFRVFSVPHLQVPAIADDASRLVTQGYPSATASRVGPVDDEHDYEDFIAKLRENAPSPTVVVVPLATPLTPNDMERAWQTMTEAQQEAFWREDIAGLARSLGAARLARLSGASERDLARFASRGFGLAPPVVYRLHYLTLIVATLKATYNELAVRRWFEKARQRLSGQSPDQVLIGDWSPDGEVAEAVLRLARSSL